MHARADAADYSTGGSETETTPPPLPHDRIDDLPFRRGMTAMRWAITAAYLGLSRAGVLDVSGAALWLSGGVLVGYTALFTWQRLLRPKTSRAVLTAIRYSDVLMVSMVLAALHDVRSPVWSIYFVSITAIAHLTTRREMAVYVGWITLNYAGAAVAIEMRGHAVPWAYVIAALACVQFMGMNAAVLAGGEQRLRSVIADLAVTDSLTGLPNRRQFHGTYTSTLDRAIVERQPLALLLVDVDHFKQINDRHGHPAGDEKLREVAAAMRDEVRQDDLVARFGGDEFVVVAPRTTRDDARGLADRLREAAMRCGTSVSIGVAIFPEDAQREDTLLSAADEALYAAKQAGRNCVREAA